MKVPAALVAVLAVALGLCGCGVAATGGAQTVTVTLPSMRPVAATVGHLAAPGRRISASGADSVGNTGEGAAGIPVIAPLTPAADAHLNGVSLWVPYWTGAAGVDVAIDHADVVAVAHPFDDEITGMSTVVDQSGGQLDEVEAELAQAHLDVIPTVTETAGMSAFARTLLDPHREAALLRALERIAEAPDSDGIDLDFENLAYGGSAHAANVVENGYPQLVGRLCAALHHSDRSCEVTVMAKNSVGIDDPDGLNTAVYDDAALATVADRLQVMAYDLHTPGGSAGPIAAWPWENSVLDYALGQIPANKLILGVATYGYDWAANGSASSLTTSGAEALAAAHHVPIRWNATVAEPSFVYRTGPRKHRVRHVVWFENTTADTDRAVLAADDHLAGIALWAAGDEDPSLWTALARLR